MKPETIDIKKLVKIHNALYEQVKAEIARTGKVSPELAKKYAASFQKCDALVASGRLAIRF